MPKTNPLSMLMFMPTHTCATCGKMIEYFGGWRDAGENEQCVHAAAPGKTMGKHKPGKKLTKQELANYFQKVSKR
jgi:hypothetical protein